jgi:hypothetical protein
MSQHHSEFVFVSREEVGQWQAVRRLRMKKTLCCRNRSAPDAGDPEVNRLFPSRPPGKAKADPPQNLPGRQKRGSAFPPQHAKIVSNARAPSRWGTRAGDPFGPRDDSTFGRPRG